MLGVFAEFETNRRKERQARASLKQKRSSVPTEGVTLSTKGLVAMYEAWNNLSAQNLRQSVMSRLLVLLAARSRNRWELFLGASLEAFPVTARRRPKSSR